MNKYKLTAFFSIILLVGQNSIAAQQDFLSKYNSRSNYKALIEDSLTSNTPHGDLYVKKVLAECQILNENFKKWNTDSQSDKSADAASRKLSIDSLSKRCEGVAIDDLDTDYINSIKSSRKELNSKSFAATDAIKNLDDKISYAEKAEGGKSKRAAALIEQKRKVYLDSVSAFDADPLYADSLGIRLVLGKDANGKSVFKAGNKEYALNDKVDLGLSTYLVPCELGLKCDSEEFSVVLPCASGVVCDDSRYEKIQRISKENGVNYQEILQVAKDIARGLKESR